MTDANQLLDRALFLSLSRVVYAARWPRSTWAGATLALPSVTLSSAGVSDRRIGLYTYEATKQYSYLVGRKSLQQTAGTILYLVVNITPGRPPCQGPHFCALVIILSLVYRREVQY